MSGTYLTDLDDVLRAAGCNVGEIDGWQSRARGSGGYSSGVWCVMWHHTASAGDGYDDAIYCAYHSDVAPVCNVTIGQDGAVWIVAAGCTNTNGSGGPLTLPDGRTVPVDDMNRYAFGVEISNGGTGMPYPQAQIDAAFRVSNAVAGRYISDRSTNLAEHVTWAPGRKIDPATAVAVEGPWVPRSTNSSGSWNLDDLRAECARRANSTPPEPPPEEDDDMPNPYVLLNDIANHADKGGAIIVEAQGLRSIGGAELNYVKAKKWDVCAVQSSTEWTMAKNAAAQS